MTALFVLLLVVILPAAAAVLSEASILSRGAFGIGSPIVYQSEEMSTRPCAGACNIHPSTCGEFYYYSLISYLRVTEVLDDGRLIAIGRDQTRYCFWPNEPQLRKARLRERLIYRWRFPHS
jgi:hypothetical protein